MDFDAIEACRPGSGGGMTIVADNTRNLGGVECSRRLVRLFALWRVDAVTGDRDRRSRHGQPSAVEARMRSPAHMPQLQEDPATSGVDSIGGEPPALCHRVGVDARRLKPAICLLGDGRGLGDDEPRGTPLAVVFRHQGVGNAANAGPRPSERRHHDAVAQRDVTELEGLEEWRRGHRVFRG